MYDAARLANGPVEPASVEEVGQITNRIGNSFVQDETRRAVEIALGVANPGLGVLYRSVSDCGLYGRVEVRLRSVDICRL